MLTITIPGDEFFDQEKQVFITQNDVVLEMEHSLVSLSKWESKYEKPFLSSEKTMEEVLDYVRMMTLTPDIPPEVFYKLTETNVEEINTYFNAKMTATWFNEKAKEAKAREIITAEVIYYWMISMQIPLECQYWHLNKLLTLIKVFNAKNAPEKKRSKREIAQERRRINEMRRKQMGTTG